MTTFPRVAVELPVAADRSAAQSLAEQITAQLREALADGRLAAGERLPSSRALATTLGVSRTVVTTAYTQLFAEGWLDGRHGSGTYVADGAPGIPAAGAAGVRADSGARAPAPRLGAGAARGAAAAVPRLDGACLAGGVPARPGGLSLRPGIPWAEGIDRAAWRRAWRQAAVQLPGEPPDPLGLPGLRQAVTGYLRRGRGMRCTTSQVMITRGVSAGLSLLAAALLRPGDRVGVEEPGYQTARSVFAARGAQIVPCRVDADGLVVSELPDDLRFVYTTPAHQYPLGGRLPVPRRQALVAWARATGALILEDDYDGEFRYDVAPLPTLAGLDPAVVVYLGTTTKTLVPGLGAGWLVARPDLIAVLAEAADDLGERVAEPVQYALSALLASGDLERHVRRMRHEYARRRAVMSGELSGVVSGLASWPARLTGDTAGMHMVLELPRDATAAVVAAARARGVEVVTMERYFAGPPSRHGLVLGYGATDLAGVRRACQVLAEILAGLAR